MLCIEELTQEHLQEYITKQEFIIYLQPQYSVSENTIVGAEALARWIHEGAYISPGEFIPALEQKGLITQLDCYLWECVFSLQAHRQQKGLALIPISINISREDFSRTDVYKTLTALSRQYNVDPQYIHVEITESAFVSDSRALYNSIHKLKSFGFMILIDDFGSGYSALNILKDIEADVIKLDMKFFDLTEENSTKGRSIIDSVIQMAQLLKLGLIAEGVENTEQLDILKETGCNIIQGYFFYRPMSEADFNTLLNGIQNNTPNKLPDMSSFGRKCYEESLKLTISGKYEDALTLAKRAATQIDPETDAGLYSELENLTGIIYGGIGNEMMALDHYLAGLSVSVRNDITIVSSKIYNNIGAEYQKLNDHAHANKYFELSLKEQEKNPKAKGYVLLAYKTNLNLCIGYTALREYEKAEEYLNRSYTYLENPDVAAFRFHYLTIQSELYMKTGREKEVRRNFPALLKMILNTEDGFNIWDNFERLGNLALELKEYAVLKRIIDRMEQEFKELPEEMIDLDVLVAIQEFRLAYFRETKDMETLRQEEHAYVNLCKRMCQQTWKDRATTIDYKIQLKTEYNEEISQRKLIDTDQLTGAGSRYKLEKDYKLLQKNSVGNDIGIGIGIINLDHFKEVNDTYGLLQGDRYLKEISQIIRKAVTGSGEIYRYDGDEFIVLLIDVDAHAVERMAQKIRNDTEHHQLINYASDKKLQTVSQGYVVLKQFADTDIWQLLSYANRQLFSVKSNGRHGYKIQDKTN